jgi:hypothetical protein
VTWDLSDLQGIRMVDDASGDRGSLLPEVISPEDLAAQAPHSYVLKNVPQGFVARITASPQQEQGEPFAYVASYRDANSDYFVVQSAPQAPGVTIEKTAESYTTAAGLVLEFYAPLRSPDGKQIVSATFKSPEGGGYLLTSNLPLAQVKELAEDLVQAK